MWFLMRMAFWLGVANLLLSADSSQKITSVPQVGATEVMSAAKDVDKSVRKTSQDTLRPTDLVSPWRGPQPSKKTESNLGRTT
jgi:hypothetical protein